MLKYNPDIIWKDINSLVHFVSNTKKHPSSQIDKLAGAIAEFGFDQPIVIDGDGIIIKGHGRLLASKKLKLKEVPVLVRTDLTPAQVKAARIADNRLAESEWDEDLLKVELLDLKNSHFDLTLTGFDSKELDQLLVSDEQTSIIEDEPSEVPSETTIKLGDLFILGNHRVLCGDNSDPENVNRLLMDEKPDACISDPPYGINFNTNYTRFTTGFDVPRTKHKPINDDDTVFDPRPYLHYPSVVLWGANYFAEHLPFGTWLVWDKRFENGKAFLSDAEVAWMKTGTGIYIKSITSQGFIRPEKIDHPTQKPIELMAWCMEKSKAGELIFDPFLGSGTTLMAAEQLGKRCFGMEIEPTYVQVIVDRWEKMSGQKAVLESSDG